MYQLSVVGSTRTAEAEDVAGIIEAIRHVFTAGAAAPWTSVMITTPEGMQYPVGQGLSPDCTPEQVKAEVDDLIWHLRATLHANRDRLDGAEFRWLGDA